MMADPGIKRGLRGTGALRSEPGNFPASTSRVMCIEDSFVNLATSTVVYILLGSISSSSNMDNIINAS